ncbi:hypothetical protein [Vagococcus hydrophili]|uniref:Uncharacterized protein n=1 Tax=Vagococcus hydrophili TaxID=2714947 RepID=A0A6G8AS33_9ENTE|nr:hypothetical protein [Vagococcus hydrophili]QIL47874.1 hypothetical protein G7082_04680 [Vagococcus hydrophili]
MKKSDLDKYNPKADEMTDFDFFNLGNLASEPTINKNNLSFWLPFFTSFVGLLILLLKSTYYLTNYGDSLTALAISLILILIISVLFSLLVQAIFKNIFT